jgi:hypothetical protein
LSKLWGQYFQWGYFKPLVVLKTDISYSWRQTIPAIFAGSLILTGAFSLLYHPSIWLFLLISFSYLAADLWFSLLLSVKKGLIYFFVLPAVFFILHASYGLGYLKGIFDFIVLRKHKKSGINDVPLTR